MICINYSCSILLILCFSTFKVTSISPFVFIESLNGKNGYKIINRNESSRFGSSLTSGFFTSIFHEDYLIGEDTFEPIHQSVYLINEHNYSESIMNATEKAKIQFFTGIFNDYIGKSISKGRFRGEKFDDIAISAEGRKGGGATFLIYGNSKLHHLTDLNNISSTEGAVLIGERDELSGSVNLNFCDINGDGFDDLILGFQGNSTDNRALVYVVFGSNITLESPFMLNQLNGKRGFKIILEEEPCSLGFYNIVNFGCSDINHDGILDLAIGAPYLCPNNVISAGSVFVIFGNKENWTSTYNLDSLSGDNGFRINGNFKYGALGKGLIGSIPLKDTLEFLMIGYPHLYSSFGKVYILFAHHTWAAVINVDDIVPPLGFEMVSHGQNIRIGYENSITSCDVNKDGIPDFVLCAPTVINDNYPGGCYIIFGRNTSLECPFNIPTNLTTHNSAIITHLPPITGWIFNHEVVCIESSDLLLGNKYYSSVMTSEGGIAYYIYASPKNSPAEPVYGIQLSDPTFYSVTLSWIDPLPSHLNDCIFSHYTVIISNGVTNTTVRYCEYSQLNMTFCIIGNLNSATNYSSYVGIVCTNSSFNSKLSQSNKIATLQPADPPFITELFFSIHYVDITFIPYHHDCNYWYYYLYISKNNGIITLFSLYPLFFYNSSIGTFVPSKYFLPENSTTLKVKIIYSDCVILLQVDYLSSLSLYSFKISEVCHNNEFSSNISKATHPQAETPVNLSVKEVAINSAEMSWVFWKLHDCQFSRWSIQLNDESYEASCVHDKFTRNCHLSNLKSNTFYELRFYVSCSIDQCNSHILYQSFTTLKNSSNDKGDNSAIYVIIAVCCIVGIAIGSVLFWRRYRRASSEIYLENYSLIND